VQSKSFDHFPSETHVDSTERSTFTQDGTERSTFTQDGTERSTFTVDRHGRTSLSRIPIILSLALAIILSHPNPAAASGFSTYQPATVDPPISRPATKYCSVTILSEHGFAGFNPIHTTFAPPSACPGPWSKVVLDVDTHVRGVQYDRLGSMWLGRDEIFRFSTAEPTDGGIRYHIEKDVSDYIPLMRSPRTVTTLLGNVVNKEYTGVIYMTAKLTFYEPGTGAPPAQVADAIVPVDSSSPVPSADGSLTKTISGLPHNIVLATLDLYATNHGCDEFWYSNQPDAYVAAHKSVGLCGGNAYREIDVWIDGRLANVVFPFPYIWTGGINPLLWRPLSAIHTLDVPPYEIDLDPWAGVLSDGRPHTIRVSVLDDRGSWPMDGSLMLWTDSHRAHTSGVVVDENVPTFASITTSQRATTAGDRFWLAATRSLRVRGYVDTSAGRVWHSMQTSMRFENLQLVNLATGEGDATQRTDFQTTRTTQDAAGTHVDVLTASYPFIANSTYPPPNLMKPFTLVIEAEVHQGLHFSDMASRCDETADATALLKRLKPHVDAVAQGKTSETNACSGAFGAFTIRKSSINGAPILYP
jgi:hypothetical protein